METRAMVCMLVCMLLNWGVMLFAGIAVSKSENKNKKEEAGE